MICVSCRTSTPLAAVDLSAPDWKVFQGQAIWKPTRHRPELTGDLVFATNTDGGMFVQLIKIPFPLATAEVISNHWQIAFGTGQHSWQAKGTPPRRFVWFQLAGALERGQVSGHWHYEDLTTNRWRLENSRTGESLEGEFFR